MTPLTQRARILGERHRIPHLGKLVIQQHGAAALVGLQPLILPKTRLA